MNEVRWRVVDAQSVVDSRGHVAILEAPRQLPFIPQRVFYVYDIPDGARRGAHAHRKLHQCLVCLTGAVDVTLDDGVHSETYHVDDPAKALYIPPLTWTTLANMRRGTTFFVLASAAFDESDYLRIYEDFVRASRA